MGLRYYDMTYTYQAGNELASLRLESTPIVSLEKYKAEIDEQIRNGGTVWVMGNGTVIGIPASKIVNITLKLNT